MKQTLLKLLLAIVVMTVGAGKSLASEYTYTFTSKQFSSNGTLTLNGIDWTLAGDGGYWNYEAARGQQFGSGSKPYTAMTFSTSGIPGTISQIVVNTSGASGTNAKLQITVGGTAFSDQVSLTKTATDYTFEGSASGEVVLNYTQTSEKAIYIKSITITYAEGGEVLKEKQSLTFSQTEYSVILGSTNFVEPVLSGAMTSVTYSSDAEGVATIDASTGEVSIVGEGTAVITATAIETDAYLEGSASYTITVALPVSTEGYVALVAEKAGVYYAMTSVVGDNSMGAQTVYVVNDKVVITQEESPVNLMWKITDNGTSSTIQDINDNYLACKSGSTNLYTQTSSCSWTDSDENSSWVSSFNANRSFLYSKSMDIFKNYAISNKGKDGYADTYTMAMPFADGYVRTGLTDGKFGTICLPCDVETADMKGIEVYSILGKRVDGEGNPVKLVVAEETRMEAGVPYIFKATADAAVVAYTGTSVDAPGSANGLVGVFEDTRPLSGSNNYVISSNTIKKAGANAGVRGNYAYISMDAVPVYEESMSVSKRILEIGGGNMPSSIANTLRESGDKVDVYSITGMRVRTGVERSNAVDGLKKGLYIVGGRKVIVR